MGFLDDITNTPKVRRSVCSVERWLDTVTPEVATEFAEVCADPDVTGKTIHKVMTEKYGYTGSHQTVMRHRRRDCTCS